MLRAWFSKLKIFIKRTVVEYYFFHLPFSRYLSRYIDSQTLLDKCFSEYSAREAKFFFIQVGSGDGQAGDHIYNYVHKYNWSGILIEPVDYVFEKLVKNYSGKEGLSFENRALSADAGDKDFYYIGETNSTAFPEWYCQLGSFSKSNIEKHESEIPGIRDYIVHKRVKTITFKELIGKYQVENLDLLQVDVEGYDYEVIKMIDFNKIKPKIILFEDKHLSCQDYSECKKLLEVNGYFLYKMPFDTLAYQKLCS